MNNDIPDFPRISDYLAFHAARNPQREALILESERVTYGDLVQRVDTLAAALLATGVRSGDRVATLCTPSPIYMVAFLATASIGAIWVGMNPRYSRRELEYVLRDCQPSVLLTRARIGDRDYAEDIAAILTEASSINLVVDLDENSTISGAMPISQFLAKGDTGLVGLDKVRANVLASDPCLIVYTSGSTGQPKGAMLHHGGIARLSAQQHRVWPLSTVRALNYLPINHVGCVVDISCPVIAHGGCLIFLEKFDAARSLELMQQERVTFWASVPSAFQMQLALPEFQNYDLSAVELVVWEGAPMPLPTIERLRTLCPRLATNYGMTETTSAMTYLPPTDDIELLANTVGTAFPEVELRLVREDGTEAGIGEEGEVQARSRFNMCGYWNKPEATRETLLEGNWLRTGDIGIRRPDGYWKLVGRCKEMYKSGGYNVYPREVEGVIEGHPAIDTAAVVGIPDPLWGEVGVAFVLPKSPVQDWEVIAHCRRHLANYKVPKYLQLVSAFPLLPIGKIDKVALRQIARQMAAENADVNVEN